MSHPPSFCVAGVALKALGGALGLVLVARDAVALCMAGVAQCHIQLRLTWQAWRNVTSTFILRGRRGTYGTGWRACAGFSRLWRRGTLHGRRGAMSYSPSFYLAGVAHAYIHTCIHAYIHTCIHAYMHTYMHACIHTCMHACILTYIHTYIPLCHTQLFHHLLCLSFLPRPRYNLWCSLLEEVDLWGYPVL